ncbi:MAG: FKBP-type peptidyl-prolyl cis-trans isomerase [Bacteroidales bacterium]|nr:FKBP-type peptidyl-prolyl cis-trans isomerase [Bacteroidales bacterium]
MVNEIDSISYALGVNLGSTIKNLNVDNLNINQINKGIENIINGNDVKITVEDAHSLIQAFLIDLQEKRVVENLEKANAFLEENKAKEGVVTLPSGLQYKVIIEGVGQNPLSTDKVRVHYEGKLLDGTVFDSSYERGESITFGVNQVIKGWQEALQLMRPGAKWELYIPPVLGYGERGAGASIPSNALLIFTVELMGVE